MNDNKKNCWEFNNCAHETTGANPISDGACSVPFLQKYDGKNHGVNAGRSCWQVMNDLSTIPGMGFLREKLLKKCLFCEFFRRVQEEEGRSFQFFI